MLHERLPDKITDYVIFLNLNYMTLEDICLSNFGGPVNNNLN